MRWLFSLRSIRSALSAAPPSLRLVMIAHGKVGDMRRLSKCQMLGTHPVKIPTLRDYPPPISRSLSSPRVAQRTPSQRPCPPRRASVPPKVRSPSYRRKHDCLFVPNLEAIAEVIEARRQQARVESDTNDRTAGIPARFLSPLAIGIFLTLLPPVAVALVWLSPHFRHPARVAVTVYGMFALVAVLVAIVVAVHG